MSAPAAKERVTRLEEAGVIRGFRLELDPALLGWPITAYVRVRPSPGQLSRIAELAASMPQVAECHRITGEDCFEILKIHLASIESLDDVLDRFLAFGQTTTSLVQSSPSTIAWPAPSDGAFGLFLLKEAASGAPRSARRARPLRRAGGDEQFAVFVALLVDRGDHQAHRHADIDQHRLGELQARLDRFRHRVGDAELVERAGVGGVAGAGDDGDVGPQRRAAATTASLALGVSRVTTSARAVSMPQRRRNSSREASPK